MFNVSLVFTVPERVFLCHPVRVTVLIRTCKNSAKRAPAIPRKIASPTRRRQKLMLKRGQPVFIWWAGI